MNELGFLDRLILTKTGALLHDPPHKSWCINAVVEGVVCDHEAEARAFRAKIVENTPLRELEALWHQLFKDAVKSADAMAAGLDRWFITLLLEHGVISSNTLLNVFNPRLSVNLGKADLDELRSKVMKIAGSLNNILSKLNCLERLENTPFKNMAKPLAYTLLYTLLEIMHYLENLPPSLADTRIPTHTVYDHLYASASMVNLLIPVAELRTPRGFLVVVDIPGIQEFVSASRKAGDYWAGSWLLSRVAWKITEELMKVLGPDILLSPTPRFSIALYSYVIRVLQDTAEKLQIEGYGEEAKALEELARIVLKLINEFLKLMLGEKLRVQIEDVLSELEGYALIPATIMLILPKLKLGRLEGDIELDFETSEKVIETLEKLVEKAWRSIVEDLVEYLSWLCAEERQEVGDLRKFCVAEDLLEVIKDTVSKPPTGFRIMVVDLEDVYNTLEKCVSGDTTMCGKLGRSVDLNKLAEVIDEVSRKKASSKQAIASNIARALLLHEALMWLAEGRSTASTLPMPRPFWNFRDGVLVPVISAKPSSLGWIPCSLCGAEPAVMKLRKVVRSFSWERAVATMYEEFEREDVKDLIELMKTHGTDVCTGLTGDQCITLISSRLKDLGVRPGEALGPYCLLKRIVYAASTGRPRSTEVEEKRKKLGLPTRAMPSTDDIALRAYEDSLLTLALAGKCSELIRSLCNELTSLVKVEPDTCMNALELIFCETIPKQIELAGFTLNWSYDEFVKKLSETAERFVEKTLGSLEAAYGEQTRQKICEKLLELLKARYNYTLFTPEIRNLVTTACESKRTHIVKGVAQFYDEYLIVKGDADSIRLISRGMLSAVDNKLTCSEYALYVLSALKAQKRVSSDALSSLEQAFTWMCRIVSAFYGDSRVGNYAVPISVSPSYYQALSSALTITSAKDLAVVKGVGGLLVFSGGDDVLAILPPQRLWAVFDLRENYMGSRDGFHYAGEYPLVAAIPFGRSFSARYAKIKDLMNEEIWRAIELLENNAKNTVWWIYRFEYGKDTLILSRSRSEAIAKFPLSIYGNRGFTCIADTWRDYVIGIHVLLTSGVISANMPEDFEGFASQAMDTLAYRLPELLKIASYIVERNVGIRSVDRELVTQLVLRDRELLGNLFNTAVETSGSRISPLLAEVFKLVKILRVVS